MAEELCGWRALARQIPDPLLRTDALAALGRKRCNIEGAAFFWTLPRRRSRSLLRALVAFEILADYLDRVNESNAARGIANGRHLHRALSDALTPGRGPTDYYKRQQHRDDGGYVASLIDACQRACAQMPSYQTVRPLLLKAAALTQVLALNHHPHPRVRDGELRRWAATELPEPSELYWFERSGAASAWLTVLALLALSAEPDCTEQDAACVYDAYLPWISLLGTMLDSYSDIEEDTSAGDHIYIAHYGSIDVACERLTHLTERAFQETQRLPSPDKHSVLVACMVAMYLSKRSTRTGALKSCTDQLTASTGPLVRMLLPALQAFRAGYQQRRF